MLAPGATDREHGGMGRDDEQSGGQAGSQAAGEERLGRYVLVRRLGTGGMGEVFLAKAQGARGFEKHVAIKRILPQHSANKHVVNMLVDEARISVLLNHPNVVQVLELDEDRGSHFIVMEYVDGHALSRLLRRLRKRGERTDPLVACYLAIQVLEGLQAAHTQRDGSGQLAGIIHRDVSPQNVLISMTGQVKVIDFGIARARDRLELTQGSQVKGKLRYMAPEQIKPTLAGSSGIDHRVDIFAAGIVLFEMLAMRQRFAHSGDLEIIDAILETDAPDLVAEGIIDDELMAIVNMALQRERRRRYKDAAAFAAALRGYLYAREPGFNGERVAKVMRRCFMDEVDEVDEADVVDEPAPPPKKARAPVKVVPAEPLPRADQRRPPDDRQNREHRNEREARETREARDEVTRTQFRPAADPVESSGLRPTTGTTSTTARGTGIRAPAATRKRIPAAIVGAVLGALVLIVVGVTIRAVMQPRPLVNGAAVSTTAPTAPTTTAPTTTAPTTTAPTTTTTTTTTTTPTTTTTAPTTAPRSLLDFGTDLELVVEVDPATATISRAYQPDPKYVSPARLKVQRGETIDLQFEAVGFESLRQKFQIDSDTPRVNVKMTPIPMPLIVRPIPRDAEILVNGVPYKARAMVTPGDTLTIVVRHPFYFDGERTVTATPGLQQLSVDITLEERPTPSNQPDGSAPASAARGTLVVTSTPPGADVIVDGLKLGRTPADIRVGVGAHRVTVKNTGAETTFAITIAAGEVVKRAVALE